MSARKPSRLPSRPFCSARTTFPACALLVFLAFLACQACDKEPARTDAPEAAAASPSSTPSSAAAPPEPPRAPDIIVDQAMISVGQEHLATGELGLDDRVAALIKGKPAIRRPSIDFVAMRNAKPPQVASIVSALRRANASGANVKTENRDGATVKLALSFATREPDCATVAWITKDGAIDVWPAGGATAQRVNKARGPRHDARNGGGRAAGRGMHRIGAHRRGRRPLPLGARLRSGDERDAGARRADERGRPHNERGARTKAAVGVEPCRRTAAGPS